MKNIILIIFNSEFLCSKTLYIQKSINQNLSLRGNFNYFATVTWVVSKIWHILSIWVNLWHFVLMPDIHSSKTSQKDILVGHLHVWNIVCFIIVFRNLMLVTFYSLLCKLGVNSNVKYCYYPWILWNLLEHHFSRNFRQDAIFENFK